MLKKKIKKENEQFAVFAKRKIGQCPIAKLPIDACVDFALWNPLRNFLKKVSKNFKNFSEKGNFFFSVKVFLSYNPAYIRR